MKDLCPGYKSVAADCTGPLARRPKDTSELLRRLDRVDRRPKITAIAVGFLTLAVIAGGISLYAISLQKEAREAREKILSLSPTNRLAANEQKVAELTDSLIGLKSKLRQAEEVLDDNNMIQDTRRRAFLEADRIITAELDRFEKNSLPMFHSWSRAFTDSMTALSDKMDKIKFKVYDRKRFPELREADSIQLITEVQNHATNQLSLRETIWVRKVFNEEVKQKGYAFHRPHD